MDLLVSQGARNCVYCGDDRMNRSRRSLCPDPRGQQWGEISKISRNRLRGGAAAAKRRDGATGTHAAWSKVSNMPLWAHGYSGAWRPWSAALSALTSGKRGLPYSAEYHAKVPPERSESATAVRVELVAREKADCLYRSAS